MVSRHDDTPGATPTEPSQTSPSTRGKALIVLGVAVVFLALLAMRMSNAMSDGAPEGTTRGTEAPSATVPDPVAAYEQALTGGKPIFVLFHSSTCAPCVEIDAVASRVVPEYDGRISFVDVYTEDPRARPLFAQFAFQYIPTSFFLATDGSVADQHTGVLNEDEMRARLDALLEAGAGG